MSRDITRAEGVGTVAVGLTAAKTLLPNPAALKQCETGPPSAGPLRIAEGVGFEPTMGVTL
jgi:hypothetical protein